MYRISFAGRTSAGCGRGRRQDCGLVGIPCRTGYPQRHPAGAELSAGGNESFSDAVSLWTEPYRPLLDAAHREELYWKDLNFYDHEFSDELGNLLTDPEGSTWSLAFPNFPQLLL